MDEAPKPRDIAPLRQPMVTSLGIIMGFLLGFLATWAVDDEGTAALESTADHVVAITLLIAVAMMCQVLFRLLDYRNPEEDQAARYDRTFQLYRLSIVLAFGGVGLAVFL